MPIKRNVSLYFLLQTIAIVVEIKAQCFKLANIWNASTKSTIHHQLKNKVNHQEEFLIISYELYIFQYPSNILF